MLYLLLLLPTSAYGSVSTIVDKINRDFMSLALKIGTLALIYVGYKYWKGDEDAKDKFMKILFGGVCVFGSSAIIKFIRGWF